MNAGSLPWFVRHELRLWWREASTKGLSKRVILISGGLSVLLLGWLWFSLRSVRKVLPNILTPTVGFWFAVTVWVFAFLFALKEAMAQSSIAIFDRGDLDLLMTSPISSKVIFASRLLGIAVGTFLSFSLFIIPVSIAVVLLGFYSLLGIYPAFMSIALVATSFGMLLSLWLTRILGAKRARSLVDFLSIIISSLFVLLSQLPNLIRVYHFQWPEFFLKWPIFSQASPLWFPVRALYFDPLSVLFSLSFSIGSLWLTAELLNRWFLSSTQQIIVEKTKVPQTFTPFSTNLNALLLKKEWKLILRNPYLLSRTFLPILLLIPLILASLGGTQRIALVSLLSMGTVLIGSQFATALTLIAVSAEEAPDLLQSSPVSGGKIRQLKLLSTLIPSYLLVTPLFIFMVFQNISPLLSILVFTGAITFAVILRLWNTRPIPLAQLMGRKRENLPSADIWLSLAEIIANFAWLAAAYFIPTSNWLFGCIPLGIIAVIVAVSYARSRIIGTTLGF
jgi:ABC-2 type transport system permease protein